MAIKDKYQIERHYISNKLARSGQKLTSGVPEFFVGHETANNTATADDHFAYFQNITFEASAHTFIDATQILEIIPLDEKAWHVQYQTEIDNKLYANDANDVAIGIELCRTGEFVEAYDRYIWYFAYLCRHFDKNPKKDIVSHSILDPKRRLDPQIWLERHGVSWKELIDDIHYYYKNWSRGVKNVESKRNNQIKPIESPSYLMLGDYSEQVVQLQSKLMKLGYDLGEFGADGSYGPVTDKAVKAFQRDHELVVDGVYGAKTRKALISAKPKATLPTTTYWVKSPQFHGEGVKSVQKALASIYYYPEKGAKNTGIDGYYGPKTANAVKRFQSMHGLKQDGIYGPATKKALEKVT